MRNRFTRSDRLRKRPEFLRLSRTGKRVGNRHLIGNYAEGKTDRTRLGITVTRKVGNAVTRNRLKRRVREFFRTHRRMFRRPLDINIIVKRSAADLPSDVLVSVFHHLFRKIDRDDVSGKTD